MTRKAASFSKQVKNELVRLKPDNLCCCRAELGAIIHLRGYITLNDRSPFLSILADSSSIARYIFMIIKEVVLTSPEVLYCESKKSTGSHFIIRVSDEAALKKILKYLGINTRESWISMPVVNNEMVTHDCCSQSYLRGAFIAAGSINSPQADYHLEINSEHEIYSMHLVKLMNKYGIHCSMRKRKKGYYVYFKNAEAITDFLRIIRAYPALLYMEEQRVMKSIKNQTNRVVNCDTANLDKLIKASHCQMQSIETIDRLIGLENLPPRLKEAARLRKEYPEASLRELGEMLSPPVSKSGMNHRMNRLNRLADSAKEPHDRMS